MGGVSAASNAQALNDVINGQHEPATRDRLLDAVWGWDYPAGTRAVDSRIAELRRALGDDAADPRLHQRRFWIHVPISKARILTK